MAVKLKVHERCPDCGQIAAQRKGDRIVGWHDCPNAPPGPVDPPVNFHVNEVTFIPDDESCGDSYHDYEMGKD